MDVLMNTCFNLPNANLVPRVGKSDPKFDSTKNLDLIKKSGLTMFWNIDNFAQKSI